MSFYNNQQASLGSSVESPGAACIRKLDEIIALLKDHMNPARSHLCVGGEELEVGNYSYQQTDTVTDEKDKGQQANLQEQFLETANAHEVLDETPQRAEPVIVEEEAIIMRSPDEVFQAAHKVIDESPQPSQIARGLFVRRQDCEVMEAHKLFDQSPRPVLIANFEVTSSILFLIESVTLCSVHLLTPRLEVRSHCEMVTWPTGIGTNLCNFEFHMHVKCAKWLPWYRKSEIAVKYGSRLNVGMLKHKKKMDFFSIHRMIDDDTKEKNAWDNWFKLNFFYAFAHYAVLKWYCFNYNNLGDKVDLQGVGNRGYTVLLENRHIFSCIRDDRSGDVENVAKLLIVRLAHYKVGSQYHDSWKKEGKGDIKRINSWEAFDLISCCLESRRSRSFVWRSLNCWKYTHNTCEFKVEQVITITCLDENFVTVVQHKIWVVAWNKLVQEVVASYFFQKDFRYGGSNKTWSTMSFDIKETTSNEGQYKIWKIGWYSQNFNMEIVGVTTITIYIGYMYDGCLFLEVKKMVRDSLMLEYRGGSVMYCHGIWECCDAAMIVDDRHVNVKWGGGHEEFLLLFHGWTAAKCTTYGSFIKSLVFESLGAVQINGVSWEHMRLEVHTATLMFKCFLYNMHMSGCWCMIREAYREAYLKAGMQFRVWIVAWSFLFQLSLHFGSLQIPSRVNKDSGFCSTVGLVPVILEDKDPFMEGVLIQAKMYWA